MRYTNHLLSNSVDNTQGQYDRLNLQVAAKLRVENARDLSDAEIDRVFNAAVVNPTACRRAIQVMRDNGMSDAAILNFGCRPSQPYADLGGRIAA